MPSTQKWPVMFKLVTVMKVRERWSKFSRMKETEKDMATKCDP